ncbi:huntingtin interacting protein 1 [Camelus ferus]|nr:huntingtin interacting protein 1 [Camelus ferus]
MLFRRAFIPAACLVSSNAVLCWKFCHVFHKLLRDGHPNVLKDSLRYKNELSDMSRMWGHLSEGYGQLCSIYLKLLRTKMEYHTKNPRFPGNLQMSDRQLDEAGESDVNNFFQLTVEMFDYLECELNLFQTVFNSLDMSRSVSVTTAGQCRLAPLIQVILDCSHLYDYTVKLLFKLHSCLPADTLQGHRDRFMEQFTKLKDLFYRSSNLQYFKRLIQIPQLPENPPNFLRASALSEHISPVVVIPAEASSPDSEPVLEKDDLMDMDASQQNSFDSKFDDIFGSSSSSDPFNFNSQNGVNKDEKDHLIDQLYREINGLKAQLENMKTESQRAVLQLKGRISELEAELAEQQHLRQQAADESEFLRTELDELKKKREDTEKAQRSLTEIERKAQANEQRYSKLKEKYSELVQSHADLLRKNAEVTKQVSVARQAQVDLEREKKELEDSFQRISDQAQRKTQEQTEVLESLKQELATSKQELQIVQGSLESSAQSEAKWTAQIAELEKERGSLVNAVARREEELSALREQLEYTQRQLSSTQACSAPTLGADQAHLTPTGLGGQMREGRTLSFPHAKGCHWHSPPRVDDDTVVPPHGLLGLESICQLAKDQRKMLLTESRRAAEQVVQEALRQFDEPSLFSCAGSADHLLSKVRSVSSCIEQLEKSWSQYLACPEDISGLLHSVTLLAHLTGDTIVHGSTTCLRAPPEPADSLTEACKQYGRETLLYLAFLEEEGTLENADSTAMRSCLTRITAIGEEMLSKSRAGDTGVKLEVNERILGSCTSLMQAIQVLIVASKELQREIVESGRVSVGEISRGCSCQFQNPSGPFLTIRDAADLVVQGRGKFEELMVCSREIAASTAQLVAASKVKADKDSPNLAQLQQASRGVNQATAAVVASTISGKSQIEDTDNMDFSSMTLTQIKRQEMDSQVRVLELENELQKERQKLGELRKKHYELAGVAEGWEEVTWASPAPRSLPRPRRPGSCERGLAAAHLPVPRRLLSRPIPIAFTFTPPSLLLFFDPLGGLPTVCWNGYHKKTVLSARNSKMVCSPVTVRIAPPDSKLTRSPIPEQIISSTLSSPSTSAPDPCAKETVLSALKERKKRIVEEEDQIFADSQENKRRRHDSSGSGHSAFEPLVANGVPASFVPKPGSLKRGLNSQSSDDHLNKRSRTSSMSSLTSTCAGGIPSSSRNAIASSYSSTRGLSQPPPPQLGYSITAEDLDLEKKASLQWFNKVLEDKTGPVTDTAKSPPAPQAETSAKSPAPSAPSPTPKQSILFGMLNTPPADPPVSAAPAVSSASPMFKPIFAAPPKSENEGPLPSSPSKVTTTASSSSALPTMTSTPLLTFKPVFNTMGPPTSVPLLTPFFKQTAPPATTTSAPLFTSQASATPTVASMTTASTSTDSAPKPAFGFGMSNVTSTLSSVTSTTASTSQPFLFGTPPASGASFTPAMGSIFQFGKSPSVPASATVTTFGQSLPSAAQTAASGSSTASFGGFGGTLSTSAPVTSSQPTLTFSSTSTLAFNIPFSSSAKPPLPSYPGANPQPTFGATDGQQQGATKPGLAPGFGSSFAFGNSAAPAPAAALAPAPAQPAFGSATQSAFGGLKPTASAFGTPASTQPAFGSTTAVFSFGAATTSGFGATTQTTSSGTSSSMFGSATPSPFTFGGSAAPASSGGFGIGVATAGTSAASGAFGFGAGQSGTTGSTTPFGGGLSQNSLGMPSQNTAFAFSVASTPDSKPVFGVVKGTQALLLRWPEGNPEGLSLRQHSCEQAGGTPGVAGTSTPTFGQNTPAPGVGTSGSSLSFGASSTPTQGFVGVGPFGPAAPSFSIGAGSKTSGARQRLQARRQHTRKK